MIKEEIFKKLMEQLEKNHKKNQEEITSISDAAIDAPGRNESRYDTSKVELSYLATSLSKKIVELEETIKILSGFSLPMEQKKILLGSLIEISTPGKNQTLFLLPSGGGIKINFENLEIITISKSAPIFKAIINKEVGDIIFFNKETFEIKKVF